MVLLEEDCRALTGRGTGGVGGGARQGGKVRVRGLGE